MVKNNPREQTIDDIIAYTEYPKKLIKKSASNYWTMVRSASYLKRIYVGSDIQLLIPFPNYKNYYRDEHLDPFLGDAYDDFLGDDDFGSPR